MMRASLLPRARPGDRAVDRVSDAVAAAATFPFTFRSDLTGVAGNRARPLTFGRQDPDAIEAEIYAHLEPIRRRIWAQRALLLVVRTGVLAALLWALAAILNLVGGSISNGALQSAVAVVVGVAAVLLVAQRVTFAEAARVADRRLGLGEAAGTAVELVGASAEGSIARRQVGQATDALRRAETWQVIRLRLPLRDLAVLAGAVTAALLFVYLATLRIAWPGATPSLELITDAPLDPADAALETPVVVSPPDGATDPFDPQLLDPLLDSARQELQSQNLPPDEVNRRLSELQSSLAQRAGAQDRARQALDDLATALADSSVASDAAASMRQGDYAKAATKLTELGQQSQQLSAEARQDLARSLDAAAPKVAPNNADLADRMRRDAKQLASNDAPAAETALRDLAQGVAQAGDRLKALADPNTPLDPSESAPPGDQGSAQSGDQGAAPPSDPSAAASQGLSSDDQAGGAASASAEGSAGEGAAAPDASGSSDGTLAASDVSGDGAAQGGGAGAGEGTDRAGQGEATPPGQQTVLQLSGRPSEGGASAPDRGGVPLVPSSGGGSVDQTVGGGAAGSVDAPVAVPAERNSVPLDKRQVVRDYFSAPEPGGG